MNKKAFSLIELLISIIVLGIVAVIAVPSISSIIKNSKINSFEASAKSIAKKIKNDYIAGNISTKHFDCISSKYGTNDGNYSSCTADIFVNEDDLIVSVDLYGKSNYSGLATIGAKEDLAHVFEPTNTVSLKTTILATVGNKDVNINKYNGNGLYRWGSKFIYRGGLTKVNDNGLATADYASDTDSGSDVNNFIQVPWETYTAGETCTSASNKCWRIMSINEDGTINIVRDKNESNQVYDNVHNTAASNHYYNLYLSNPTQYASYANAQNTNYGYNYFLENVPTPGYPNEYKYLYDTGGYEQTKIIKYINLLKPINVCVNRANAYASLNNTSYSTTTLVKDTCDVAGRPNTQEISPLKNKYMRIPYTEEYLNASLESTCTGDNQFQCRNQNFMYSKQSYWNINGVATNSFSTRHSNISGGYNTTNASSSTGVKPVVTLKSSVLILPGDSGAATDPYVIKW
jgi:prepilin-type N-terminal cleavage/methylation domain-containing protein